eukprot:766939-Hanusia_phi.AAC.2
MSSKSEDRLPRRDGSDTMPTAPDSRNKQLSRKRCSKEHGHEEPGKRKRGDAEDHGFLVGLHGKVVEIDSGNMDAPIMVSDEQREDGTRVRRLRFFHLDRNSDELVSDHIQTEMALIGEGVPDPTRLMLQYHQVMYDALSRLSLEAKKICILGHGAGALSSFLSSLSRFEVCGVDNSQTVLRLGREYFDDRGKVFHEEGCEFLRRCSMAFDVVLVDLNASREALDAPPKEFYTERFVRLVSNVSSNVIVNVLGGDEQARLRVFAEYSKSFSTCWIHPEGCDNYILVASKPQSTHTTR